MNRMKNIVALLGGLSIVILFISVIVIIWENYVIGAKIALTCLTSMTFVRFFIRGFRDDKKQGIKDTNEYAQNESELTEHH